MSEQPCECYTEWMSLAQDGMLNGTQSHLLHAHLATCRLCHAEWEGMNLVSRMLHATPVAQPSPGFVQRFDSRLAYRQEQRRQGMIWILLGIGVIALVILALPSLIALLSLTSRMVLPHEVITYVNGLFNWAYIVLSALADAGWVLVRHFIATPVGIACLGSISLAGILIITWTRSLVGRMSAQNTK